MTRRRPFPTPRKPNGGMTLIELAIASAISLIAVLAIMSMFIAASKMGVESFLRNKAAMEARIVIDTLTTDARAAVAVPSSGGGYTAGPTTLILQVPSIDANGLPIDMDTDDGTTTTATDFIIYHQADNPNELMRTVVVNAGVREAGSRVVGTSSNPTITVSGTYSVQPDALGIFIIHYQFTSVQSRAGKDYTKPVAGSIRLRNQDPST